MSRKEYTITILILGTLATISPFSVDMYLPGFPAIAADLNTSIANVQLSLTSYFAGISVGQLIYGPLLDRFGRKKPLYVGLFIYILASLACVLTNTVESLIFMRFIQALGGCVGMVAANTLVRDLFPVNKTAQAFSLVILVIAVSPMIAPAVGAYVTASLGWHYVFLILAIITAAIIPAVYFILPEGNLPDTALSIRLVPVFKAYWEVSKNPQFLTYMLTGGIATSAIFAYIAGSPDVFINIYKLNETQYGWIFGILAFAMIGTTQLNHLLLKVFSSREIIRITLIYQSISGILLVAGTIYDWFNLYTFVGLMFIFLTGQGLTNPNAAALTLAPFSKNAGSASALMGSFRMGMGGLVSAMVSVMHDGTAVPMVIMMTACALAGLLAFSAGRKSTG
ncbi:MAG: multidrug effflux MFS transporter [Cyclobacteriaceae bacterium]|nr:multidrug effflux MFS transporter [Cyclobacteriaceae bacterium]